MTEPAAGLAETLRHGHVFLGAAHDHNGRRMGAVVGISLFAMAVELACGLGFHSMALLGEGLHMASHAGVFLVALLAYRFARSHAEDPRFSFGTGKVGDLCGFGSAILLGVVALLLGAESLGRLARPLPIALDEALPVAAFGLAVSVLSAWLLHRPGPGHSHSPASAAGQDLNLRAAYVHLLSDIVVSLLALVGLGGAKLMGWSWLDPAAGVLGSGVVARFAWSLAGQTATRLLDAEGDPALARALRDELERGGERVADLHVWRLGPGHDAAIVVIASPRPAAVAAYRQRIADIHPFSHLTVEVHRTAE